VIKKIWYKFLDKRMFVSEELKKMKCNSKKNKISLTKGNFLATCAFQMQHEAAWNIQNRIYLDRTFNNIKICFFNVSHEDF